VKLEFDLQELEKKNERTEIGLHEIVKSTIQENFQVYKVMDEKTLALMLSQEAQKVLKEQFMLPLKTQQAIDSSPGGLFRMVDATKIADISMIELEIGFRKMKEVLDRKNLDYKVLIFDIKTDQFTPEEEEDKDPDEIRNIMAYESLKSIPLMKEEFIHKVSFVIKDELLVEKIALGCQ
jgi:hypothetical protein